MEPWNNPDEPWQAPPSDWLAVPRALMRMLVVLVSVLIALLPFLILRYGQRIFGLRHLELAVLQLWGKVAVWCFGIKVRKEGEITIDGGLITSNHVNFIDIPLIFSVVPGYMMAKSEVKKWPFIGWCAQLIGTEFVVREPTHTSRQVASLTERIKNGDRMIIFPEATTTDGQRIIPFRSSFFEAIAKVENNACVQPIAIFYHAPKGASVNFFGYWGGAKLMPQMLATLASKGLKTVDVKIHAPLPSGLSRKELAQAAETATRDEFTKLKDAALALRADQAR